MTYQQAAEKGIKVLYVDVSLVEIKEVEQQYTDTAPITQQGAKKAGNVSAKDMGKQQAQDPQKNTSAMFDMNGGKKFDLKDAIKNIYDKFKVPSQSSSQMSM